MAKQIKFNDALEDMARQLTNLEPGTAVPKVGSFWNFIRDIWSQGFAEPEFFSAWHVGQVCEDVDRAIEEGKNYVAVMPRMHFKSTILGHGFSIWTLLKKPGNEVVYLSYSDQMSQRHISEINKEVKDNAQLSEWMTDRTPKSDNSFRYMVGGRRAEVMHHGLFSFQRGLHVDGAMVADDILRDLANPLDVTQMQKVEEQFMTANLFIPNPGSPIIVIGTPMMSGDIFDQLAKDERFIYRRLPVFDEEYKKYRKYDSNVLFPERYDTDWLKAHQEAKPKSFASEFMLEPYLAGEAYFTADEIRAVEDPTLKKVSIRTPYITEEGEEIFAGFDVGKKRHPSHLAIFSRKGDKITQLYEEWLEGWNYDDQAEFLNDIARKFPITRAYIDLTRGELEDRQLDVAWLPKIFTQRNKFEMAQIFEQAVFSGNLTLLAEDRQRGQIVSTSNDLKAPEMPDGHGESFISLGLALQAAYELRAYGYSSVGSLTEWQHAVAPSDADDPEISKEKLTETPEWIIIEDSEELSNTGAPNPKCAELACNPSFWVPENNLCIYCRYKGNQLQDIELRPMNNGDPEQASGSSSSQAILPEG